MAISPFKIFTSDATGTPPNPATATTSVSLPFPSNLVGGNISSIISPPEGNGYVFQNFDGIIVQDFGVPSNFAGGSIKFGDGPVLTATQIASLYAMYIAVDTFYYFTDGIDFYKVYFSRNPAGFNYWHHYIVKESMGFTRYSYEISFVVYEKLT